METWKKMLLDNPVTPEEISTKFNLPLEKILTVAKRFPLKITRYYFSLIKEINDPLYKQVIPDERELEEHKLMSDPLAEDKDSPVNCIVHRYPDRCLFLVSPFCASYCRFCTRSRKVGDPSQISPSFVSEGFDYIKSHNELRDIIISGGDPLMLDDDILEYILSSLRSIPHIQIIRIGTRMPCFLPHRITNKLTKMLKKYHPLYVNVHFNHPDELTPEANSSLAEFANAGIPLGNQTVLLKGVNDVPETMKKLMHKLLIARVRPYYIYQADMVLGTEHFRTTVQKGIEIMEKLRGWTSGLAVPQFVIDAPDGGGKIPLLPNYVHKLGKQEVILRNYKRKQYRYLQPYAEANQMEQFNETCRKIFERELNQKEKIPKIFEEKIETVKIPT